jgi:hypothetical protein
LITYTGQFNEDAIVSMARDYIAGYSPKHKLDEIKIPFKKKGSDKVRYVEFARLAENWIFIKIS